MNTMSKTNEIRELSADELDAVSGAFKVSFAGITLQASGAHMGVAVSIEGGGGISVSGGGITVKDSKGNIGSATWGEILGGGKK